MEHKNVIRVVAATLDKQVLILYREDGESVEIPQGDPRIKAILEQVIPVISQGQAADIDLGESSVYAAFEKKSGGVVRFFKAAKSKLVEFFAAKQGEPKKKEQPAHSAPSPSKEAVVGVQVETMAAVNDVMTHLEPLDIQDHVRLPGSHTLVAMVDNQVIAGVESLKPQLTRATTSDTEAASLGVQRFLQRLAAVIEQRRHSVDDLMKFSKKADLPITDDGCLLAYKVLRKRGDGYVDCHTGKVTQKVGSYVHMDPSLVDPDRSRDCSNGLHIARGDYIKSFSGDACVLVKVKPEDVIAVPQYDSSKMRVCGYHILHEVSDEEYRLLKSNQAFTEEANARKQLAAALRGDHIGITQYVKITGQQGNGLVITEAKKEPAIEPVVKAVEAPIFEEAEVLDLSDKGDLCAPVIDPMQVVEQVAASKGSRQAQAQELLKQVKEATSDGARKVYIEHLIRFKKAAKVGWDRLGITPKDIAAYLDDSQKQPVPQPQPVKEHVVENPVTTDQMELLFIDPVEIAEGKHDNEVKKWVNIKRKQKKRWPKIGIDDVSGKAMLSRFNQMNHK